MGEKLRIIDAAITLINFLSKCKDKELVEYVYVAVNNYDIGMLLDLEEAFEE